MKKMFVILAAMLAASVAHAAPLTAACDNDPCGDDKAYICHYTSANASKPYTINHVSKAAGPHQPAFQGHLAHLNDLCAEVTGTICTGRYKDVVVTCPTTPPPTPTPFGLPCDGGNCETSIHNSTTFDFEVLSGGINQDLYVCEVGFRVNDCPTCNAKDDLILVHLANGTIVPITYTEKFKPFGLTPQALSAEVLLNSLDYSAGWYVRYCSKTTRLVVGEDVTANLAATIKATAQVDATYDNGYLLEAGLKFGVTHECNNLGEVFAPIVGDLNTTPHGVYLLEPASSVLINTEDFLCLSGEGCGKEMCNWTVHFQETACTLRKIKTVECVEGVLDCTPFKTNIHTTLSVDTDFTCVTTDCL